MLRSRRFISSAPRKTQSVFVDAVTALHSTVRYAEVCLASRCIETECITPLLYCCVSVLLSNAVSVAQ
jgi:hypothetical protein